MEIPAISLCAPVASDIDQTESKIFIAVVPQRYRTQVGVILETLEDFRADFHRMKGISVIDNPPTNPDGTINTKVWADGAGTNSAYQITKMNSYQKNPDPYSFVAKNDDAIVYVPETGELSDRGASVRFGRH